MRQAEDSRTLELPGLPAKAQRKKAGRPRQYATAAEKQRAYRERKGVELLTVELPIALSADFKKWLERKGETKSGTVARLIQTQLLRKR